MGIITYSGQAKHLAAWVLALLLAFSFGNSYAGKYLDKEDEKGLEHFSRALMSWYEVNQQGQPNGDADIRHIILLLNRIHSDCAKVPYKTLRKIDVELTAKFRSNLQEGAHFYASGMSEYRKAMKDSDEPSPKSRLDMINGQQRMVQLQRFYNTNIECIINFPKSKVVEIFGKFREHLT